MQWWRNIYTFFTRQFRETDVSREHRVCTRCPKLICEMKAVVLFLSNLLIRLYAERFPIHCISETRPNIYWDICSRRPGFKWVCDDSIDFVSNIWKYRQNRPAKTSAASPGGWETPYMIDEYSTHSWYRIYTSTPKQFKIKWTASSEMFLYLRGCNVFWFWNCTLHIFAWCTYWGCNSGLEDCICALNWHNRCKIPQQTSLCVANFYGFRIFNSLK